VPTDLLVLVFAHLPDGGLPIIGGRIDRRVSTRNHEPVIGEFSCLGIVPNNDGIVVKVLERVDRGNNLGDVATISGGALLGETVGADVKRCVSRSVLLGLLGVFGRFVRESAHGTVNIHAWSMRTVSGGIDLNSTGGEDLSIDVLPDSLTDGLVVEKVVASRALGKSGLKLGVHFVQFSIFFFIKI